MGMLPRLLSRLLISIVFLASAGWGAPAHAQTGAASITGLLIDQSGAAVAGATVVATNQSTAVGYAAVTNDAGAYTITSVPVGTYVLKAELSGFKAVMTLPMAIEAGQIARLDFLLEVGAVQETVM